MEKQKRITFKDVARKVSLPVATVSYAFSNLPGLQKNVRRQIVKAANELGYVNNTHVKPPQKKVVAKTGFNPGALSRVITMADIADFLHVSVATVSRALNGSKVIGSKTTQKVLQAAHDLGYVLNTDARDLRAKGLANLIDGKRRVTIYDIADVLNLSPSTVSRCYTLNGDVSPATKERVLNVGRAMGYTIQENAHRLRAKNVQINCL